MQLASLLKLLLLSLAAAGAAHAQSDRPIRVGVMSDMAGMTSEIVGPGSVIAAKMAVEDFGGKIGNRPIEVVSGDHQNKPDTGSTLARRWLDVEGVHMIVDVPNSSVALAVQEVVKIANKVILHTAGASPALTGKSCTPNSIHWSRDSYGLAQSIGKAVVKSGGDTWFFVTADYAFGHATEAAVGDVVKKSGGKILGSARHPTNASDFASFLLQAQASNAKVIGMANAGADTILAVKQAAEFGITKKQRLVASYINISEIHALGLKAAQGAQLVDTAYWDLNDDMRQWSRRFFERHKKMPTSLQADVYSAVTHYLKAVKAGADPNDGVAVVKKMKTITIDGPVLRKATIREDGRVVRDYYLFRVKTPDESKTPWDYYKLEATVPGEQLVVPLSASECPLVRKAT